MYITIDNIKYPVEIIRKNNKNTYIRIKEGTIVVTTSYFTTTKSIQKLITDNESSILKMLNKAEKKQEKKEKNSRHLTGSTQSQLF